MDTNVWVAALRSSRGASHLLLRQIDSGHFQIALSVPLIIEYEDVALRLIEATALTPDDIADLLDYLCAVAHQQQVFYLWRPFLRDPRDDMVLELAVAAECEAIITYNIRDFEGVSEQFGIRVMTPKELLERLGQIT